VATPRQKQISAVLPGEFLRARRERLGMTLRDVQHASSLVAEKENNDEMSISSSWLSEIETESSAPSVQKLFSLSVIYGISYHDLLARYNVHPDRVHQYREVFHGNRTRPFPADVHNLETNITLPMQVDPRFRWETTQLVNRMIAVWGEIPASLLINFNPRNHMIGLVGLEDNRMWPLLRPGAIVLIDGDQRKIVTQGWKNEHERPIYFVELRDGYRCCWCQLVDGKLFITPHPLSRATVETFNLPGDAEIVGQVVGIAMRIVPAEPTQEP
jgi:transcriptional regulator with XRE-family HTH domain